MRTHLVWKRFGSGFALTATLSALAGESTEHPIDAIKDNSFFVEEAYNQEAGVVQHIVTLGQDYTRSLAGEKERTLVVAFTQEWPLVSQRHQLSYTIPYVDFDTDRGGADANGLGDVLLHYRIQALFESASQLAFAPRLSLILPTGEASRGLGEGKLGYQFNLPASKSIGDRWAVHANLGFTTFPGLRGRDPITPHLAGSVIYALEHRLHLLVETVATWPQSVSAFGSIDRGSEVILSPGLRYALNWENSQCVVGLGVPFGLKRPAPEYGFLVYVSFEHSIRRAR